jgi:transposase-like protein
MNDPYTNAETPWRDAETLKELYVCEGMNTYEIAEELDTTHPTVSKWLDEHGIREKQTINRDRPWQDEERVRELYEERKLTISELAEEMGCAYQTAYRWVKKHGIETRGAYEESVRVRRRKPPWHHYTRGGYEVVETDVDGSTKQARIHRLVMVSEHGIEAVKGNHVHHKNGIPWDNRPENLEIIAPSEHAKQHEPVEVRWGNKSPIEALEHPR